MNRLIRQSNFILFTLNLLSSTISLTTNKIFDFVIPSAQRRPLPLPSLQRPQVRPTLLPLPTTHTNTSSDSATRPQNQILSTEVARIVETYGADINRALVNPQAERWYIEGALTREVLADLRQTNPNVRNIIYVIMPRDVQEDISTELSLIEEYFPNAHFVVFIMDSNGYHRIRVLKKRLELELSDITQENLMQLRTQLAHRQMGSVCVNTHNLNQDQLQLINNAFPRVPVYRIQNGSPTRVMQELVIELNDLTAERLERYTNQALAYLTVNAPMITHDQVQLINSIFPRVVIMLTKRENVVVRYFQHHLLGPDQLTAESLAAAREFVDTGNALIDFIVIDAPQISPAQHQLVRYFFSIPIALKRDGEFAFLGKESLPLTQAA